MIAIDTMRANVFRAPEEFSRRGGRPTATRTGRGPDPRDAHDDLRDRRPHRQGRVPGSTGPRPRARAGRRDRGARRGRDRLRGRRARPRRRDHAVRPVRRLPLRPPLAVRPRVRLRGHRRLAVRQHDRRRAGRVPARAVRAGEPGEDPRRRDRRAGRPAGRHRLHRLRRRRVGRRPHRRHRRRVRPGADRAVRDGRREADGRGAGHRRRQRPGPARDGEADGRRRRARLHEGRRRRRGQAPDRRLRRRRGDRGARHAADVRERAPVASAGRHAVEPRRLLRQARDAVRGVRGRPRRPPDRHHALPRRQGADGPADRDGPGGPVRPDAADHPPLPR